jgi:hypothetical protein
MREPLVGDLRSPPVLTGKQRHVRPDLGYWGGPQGGEIVGDVAQWSGWHRYEEVRGEAAGWGQDDRPLELEALHPAAERPQPGHMQRGVRGIAEREQRTRELPHRRDREPREGQVLERENEPDHGYPFGTMTSRVAPSGSRK